MPVLAQADTTDIVEPNHEPPTAGDGWQAGTCVSDAPVQCSPETPELFFKQAAGHPPVGYTQYLVQHGEITPTPFGTLMPIKEPIPDRKMKTLRVDLPPGLTVNPNATPKCPLAAFEAEVEVSGEMKHVPQCPTNSIVGEDEVTLVVNTEGAVPAPPPAPPGTFLPKGFVIPPSAGLGTKIPVYNIQPKEGEPALFGFVVGFEHLLFLETAVAWQSDFHESFTIHEPEPEPPFTPLKNRLVNFGREAGNVGADKAGNGTFITNPTTCFNPNEFPHLYSTWLRAESWGEPNPTFPVGSTPVEAKVEDSSGTLIQQEGCGTVPFEPSISMDPGTGNVDSPSAATVNVKLPFDPAKEGGAGQSQSHVRKAEVTLPKYMGLNPSGAQGLVACTDAQFKKGVRDYNNNCPSASKVGTATVESPPLERPLSGEVYVGTQNSTDPQSGEEFRILVEAKEPKEGIDARLVGHTKADPNTGQLTAVFDEQQKLEMTGSEKDLPSGLPQVPFTSVKLQFDGGDKAVLTSPPICSSESTSKLEPYARPGTNAEPKSTVTLTSDPTGGDCPKTMADRKFTPTYHASPDSTKAGAYSPFHVLITRKNGEQELKVVNVTLPKGLTGKLAGIPYCPETAIDAPPWRTGKEEIANPSCPAASQIGTVTTRAGTGNPLELGGKVYLAGPYKGAPISFVTITPAIAGPFDLGIVIVRVPLYVEPETAQIHAVSNAIPDVFYGVKLDLRSINLSIDRKKFMLNPTNCAAQATTGVINGGGADPANPATFSSYAVNDPFQATGCRKLGFKPKLKVTLYGPTKRAKNPRLKAVLEAKKGQANVLRTALTMPHSLFLDQGHIGTVCTRPQLASHTCPTRSVYGTAEAKSPLLDKKLRGKVFLVSSNHELPDLLVDLRGQVEIYLRGVISGKHGGLKTVFNKTPDVPVSRFVLKMKGGKKSLLENSTNTCAKPQRAVLNIKGQNGKKVKNNRFRLNIASCNKRKKHHK
ncbi:MAG TPA: hypothetical protein VFN85_08650 [Solirubrobacterales bacterium]|nr:hypothetical protein [Solirubrobacterales bacterium]